MVDKPKGLSSFGVVSYLRRLTGVKKIGHCGTLDPFASGLLILAIDREFTRQIDRFVELGKCYSVKMRWGIETDTLDAYGRLIRQVAVPVVPDVDLSVFKGNLMQVAPSFSAKKKGGKRLYKLARQGEFVTPDPHAVTITAIDNYCVVDNCSFFSVCCSKGTYIRSLVRDIGCSVDLPAYTQDLRRVSIGDYHVDDAVSLCDLTLDGVLSSLFV